MASTATDTWSHLQDGAGLPQGGSEPQGGGVVAPGGLQLAPRTPPEEGPALVVEEEVATSQLLPTELGISLDLVQHTGPGGGGQSRNHDEK